MHQDNNNNNNFNDGDDDNKGFNRMDPNWASDGHEPYRSRSRSISPEPNSDPEEHRNINPDDFAMFSDFWQENPHLRDEAFREGWQQAMMATEDDLLKSNLIDTCSKCYLISFKYSKFSAKIRKLQISIFFENSIDNNFVRNLFWFQFLNQGGMKCLIWCMTENWNTKTSKIISSWRYVNFHEILNLHVSYQRDFFNFRSFFFKVDCATIFQNVRWSVF